MYRAGFVLKLGGPFLLFLVGMELESRKLRATRHRSFPNY